MLSEVTPTTLLGLGIDAIERLTEGRLLDAGSRKEMRAALSALRIIQNSLSNYLHSLDVHSGTGSRLTTGSDLDHTETVIRQAKVDLSNSARAGEPVMTHGLLRSLELDAGIVPPTRDIGWYVHLDDTPITGDETHPFNR